MLKSYLYDEVFKNKIIYKINDQRVFTTLQNKKNHLLIPCVLNYVTFSKLQHKEKKTQTVLNGIFHVYNSMLVLPNMY